MITQAQKARAEKYLNSLIRHNDKTMTVKEWLNLLKNEGYTPSIETVRDDAKEEKESERLRQIYRSWDFPFGNPNHPDVIKYNQDKENLAKETAYINDKSKTTYTLGYKNVFPFDAEYIDSEDAINKIYGIARNRKVGTDAEVEYIRTDNIIDAATGLPKTTPVAARKFKCSVEVTEISGDPGGELKMTGNLNGIGDFVEGTFNLTTKVFTATGS